MLTMNPEDTLILQLQALCLRYSDSNDPLEGRYEVARRAGLSEQYLYQMLAAKPMANGSLRSVGKIARQKLTNAFPDWLSSYGSAPSNGTKPEECASVSDDAIIVAQMFDRADEDVRQAVLTFLRLSDQNIDMYQKLEKFPVIREKLHGHQDSRDTTLAAKRALGMKDALSNGSNGEPT